MQDVTNITCQHTCCCIIYIWFIYVQTDLAKIKGSTRGFESVVVIIEYSPTFSYHLRRLDYESVTPDHTKNTKEFSYHLRRLDYESVTPDHTKNTKEFSYHLRRLDYESVTLDHTKNNKDCQLNTLEFLF